MLVKLRSVSKLAITVACFCSTGFILASGGVSAQEMAAHIYQADASAGVWVNRTDAAAAAIANEQAATPSYQPNAMEMPGYDSATAAPEYDAASVMESPTYTDAGATYYQEPSIRAVVKNKDLFGVDKDKCCDEWSKLCKFKDMKFGCSCGGLKAKKGHLGVPWFRSRDEVQGCDYCQGGCCDKQKRTGNKKQEKRNSTSPTALSSVFTSAWNKATGNDSGADGVDGITCDCPKEEQCTSCQ